MPRIKTLIASVKRPKLLVVDDQPIISQILQEQLKEHFEVFVAHSGSEALESCNLLRPDIVLVDVVMPEMNGIELCHRIKKSLQLSRLPVMFLTSSECKETEQQCWQAGCSDYLIKPFSTQSIIIRLKSHLGMQFRIKDLDNQSSLQVSGVLGTTSWHEDFLNKVCEIANLSQSTLSLCLVQVSNLDTYIKTHGWVKSDRSFTKLSQIIINELPSISDISVRVGRDRFLCILPNAGAETARHFTFMLRLKLKDMNPFQFEFGTGQTAINVVSFTRLKGHYTAQDIMQELDDTLEATDYRNSDQIQSFCRQKEHKSAQLIWASNLAI